MKFLAAILVIGAALFALSAHGSSMSDRAVSGAGVGTVGVQTAGNVHIVR